LNNYILILIAIALDLLIGDPVTSLHPVRMTGNLILKIETLLYNSNLSKRISGLIGVICSLGTVIIIFIIFYNLTGFIPYGKEVFSVLIYYSTFAIRDLAVHGMKVKRALDNNDIILARKSVSMILSRDTQELTPDKIITGTVESMSENSSDSIIAPIFWGFFFGPIGALSYRVINTMDAMWGYKNERFIDFGRTAALLDDAVNFIPARITGSLICLASLLFRNKPLDAWKIMIRDHSNTASPNAGYPEAAMAGALNIQLGGEASYFNRIVNKPTIGDPKKNPGPSDIPKSLKIIAVSTVLFLLIIIILI
jgi:adenosylcobinamide-phosphate synthase